MIGIDGLTLALALIQIAVVLPALRSANGHSPLLVGYGLVSSLTVLAAFDAFSGWPDLDRGIYRLTIQGSLIVTFFWATWPYWRKR